MTKYVLTIEYLEREREGGWREKEKSRVGSKVGGSAELRLHPQ